MTGHEKVKNLHFLVEIHIVSKYNKNKRMSNAAKEENNRSAWMMLSVLYSLDFPERRIGERITKEKGDTKDDRRKD